MPEASPAGRGKRTSDRAWRSMRWACAALLTLVGCGGFGQPDLTVIVISLDTTRPDHLTPYNADLATTPMLARLAREGTLFTNARSTAPWTLPAHMSLFTGLPPGLHNVIIDFQALDLGRRTLGEIFKDAGYRTMGVYSGPYVHQRFGFGRGMLFYERATVEPMLWDLPPAHDKTEMMALESRSHLEQTSRGIMERAVNMLRGSTNERNLLFLHYFDPHYDYVAPPNLVQRFADPAYRGPITGMGIIGNPAIHAGMPDADLAQLKALYDAEIAYVDETLGVLIAELKRQGRLDSTLIVVTADHGEAFFEHGRFGHRQDLSDEVLKVPLIVWGPGQGIPANRVVDDPVSLIDILPTLIDYAGLPAEPTLDGLSLRPVIEGGHLQERRLTAALSFFPADPQGYYVLHEGMITGGMKLERQLHVAWETSAERDLSGSAIPGSETYAIYDLQADPGESHDLYGTDDPRVESLLATFEAERERQRERLAEFTPQGAPAPSVGLQLHEIMKSMGY